MKTPEEIKKDLAAWGTGVRIDIGCGEFVPPTPEYMLNGVRSADVCRDALTVNGHGNIRMMGFWSKRGEQLMWLHNGRFKHYNDITHWMPLPSTEGIK